MTKDKTWSGCARNVQRRGGVERQELAAWQHARSCRDSGITTVLCIPYAARSPPPSGHVTIPAHPPAPPSQGD
ncbi:hypothetical protein LZ30DRAFT_742766 [Colletotrichum cereale]|nr:hypothetical protein LZ30DRAFT_742766 [Colletotrichum cereale]